jgi:hypothetical protein
MDHIISITDFPGFLFLFEETEKDISETQLEYETFEDGEHFYSEVYTSTTGQTLWKSSSFFEESAAEELAKSVKSFLIERFGFGTKPFDELRVEYTKELLKKGYDDGN